MSHKYPGLSLDGLFTAEDCHATSGFFCDFAKFYVHALGSLLNAKSNFHWVVSIILPINRAYANVKTKINVLYPLLCAH